MKVLSLQCHEGHVFEGWFASHEDFDMQQTKGLLTCPLCNDARIVKLPSAPRLNLGHSSAIQNLPVQAGDPAQASSDGLSQAVTETVPHARVQDMQATWMKMVRHVMANTEDVGMRFAQEARKIHQGQAPERAIRGQATRAETEALREEGIDILTLPIPAVLKEPLQ